MKPTIRTIAELCGVSRGTVDRVLNDRPYVSPEIRRRVLRAVEQTGYVRAGSGKPSRAPVQIGFLVTKWEDDYFLKQTERGIRRAKKFLSLDKGSLQVDTMRSRSNSEYIHRIYDMIDAGARGIILNAADNLLLSAVIDDLAEKGIPVVTYNSDLPASRSVCHVGQDLEKSGQVAAGLLARSLGPMDRILAVTGNLEFRAHRSRIDSFCMHAESLGIAGDRIELRECFERYDLTYDTVLEALQRDSRIRGIFMGTESVPACMDAIKKARVRHAVHVVANDLTKPAIRGLKDNRIDFVVEQDFSAQAYEAIVILHALLRHGRTPKTPVRYVPTSIYTKELL